MKTIDLSLQLNEMFYNVRVAIILEYNGMYIFEKSNDDYYFLPGGRVKYQETLESAIIREVYEELGVEIIGAKLIAVCENHFHKEHDYQEHCFIFYKKLKGTEILNGDITPILFNCLEIERHIIQPNDIPNLIKNGLDKFQLLANKDIEIPKFEKDLCFEIGYDEDGRLHEMNIRATALIQTKLGVLVDTTAEKDEHLVCIGGRMHLGEMSRDAIIREVQEEIDATISNITFRGRGEDFFYYDSSTIKKYIHFISFVYDVEIVEETVKETAEVSLNCYSLDRIFKASMGLASTQSFLADAKIVNAVSKDRVVVNEK